MKVFIGIGSNLNQPLQQIKTAIETLQKYTFIDVVKVSCLYYSKPLDNKAQPDYINGVILLKTNLSALDLLDVLQQIENQHGRDRSAERWSSRPLDLDILLYGSQQINNERLQIPHPGVGVRAFVLLPLAELAPDLTIPGLGKLKLLVKTCPTEGLQKII
ncbi:MAG: 2-amino-4-hydroxy-6-hydroxymethyldihydropteridine diphosphokinase [Methylococcales bacterium]|jgi:2-amino-4-hydroxy-6-hydroxymethyldihydropteridine diphosphokinase|nr:2-amino-4-hydroxy-6-hydroxymethyldihydropteridine diphosphokinase [Methylococcales bacterium]MBT7408170.1 2-amino-4-hydroxy-6-hydroxymethyldihydropteridine diphosphokinase [Methylococcales bacterium]